VHSENEADHAKRGIRACALDLMMELAPDPPRVPQLLRPKATPTGPEADFLTTVGETCLAIGRLPSGWHVGFAEALKAMPFLCGPTWSAGAKPESTQSSRGLMVDRARTPENGG
jgi:putative DNA methylase